MTERIITIAEAQHVLERLTEQTTEETLLIASDDQPLLTLMPYHAYQALLANVESLQTMLEIMLSGTKSEIPRSPRPEKAALVSDKSTSWEEFKEEVGWE